MTPELQAFIEFFKEEEDLRSAIEGLLVRREECSGVRNLHGKDEAGKDLVFYAPIGLGRLALNACVVKIAKISGSASDPRSGARNVLIQCDQALDTPVIGSTGQEEWVNRIYVMSANELSPTAMDSIAGNFKGKPSQIEFMCGQELLSLFQEGWPDFIFFEPDLLSAHLEGIGKELESDKNIQRLAIAHGLNPTTRDKNIYVEPVLSHPAGQVHYESSLLDRESISKFSKRNEVEGLGAAFDNLLKSSKITEYLPKDLEENWDKARTKLSLWPERIRREWTAALRLANKEALKHRGLGSDELVIPAEILEALFTSQEYRVAETVNAEFSELVRRANRSLQEPLDRLGLLSSEDFAKFCSLVHDTNYYFPTIQFKCTGLIEWLPDEALAGSRNLFVTAAPGYGKTSFCRNHFLRDLKRFKAGASTILPLYFAAHTLTTPENQTFKDVFIRPEVAARVARDPALTLRIYVDGLDEITPEDLRTRIISMLREQCSSADCHCQCIVTAREHIGGLITSWMTRINLSPMSESNLRELVTSWLEGEPGLISSFYSELEASDSLAEVLKVPLLATLTILVFKTLKKLPENRLRLYQMFIDLLLGGWNLAKGLQRSSKCSSTSKSRILTRLAGRMHAGKRKESDVMVIASAIREVTPLLFEEWGSVVGELVEDGLLIPTGRSSYVFPHLPFQEYLAAKDAIDPAREIERQVVTSYLAGEDWDKEVATFISSMTTNPVKMRDWIRQIAGALAHSAKPAELTELEKRTGLLTRACF